MSVHARLTKLNPTTLTTPSPRAGGSILKITCSPYLSIQNPDLATLKAARQNADGLFEVIVPVGGKVEVKIEAEVGCLMGDQGANLEFEVEEAVTEEVMKILDRNRSILDLDAVVVSGPSIVRLHPSASAGHRAGIIENIIPRDMPVAHLVKIDITLAWTTLTPASIKNESQTSSGQDQNESQMQFITDDEDEDVPSNMDNAVSSNGEYGHVPGWARSQLRTAIGNLFRGEMIKRFPLIFDSGCARYINRITPSPTLSNTLNRCLHLSEAHSTSLRDEMKGIILSIETAQRRIVAHRQSQAALLKRKGGGRKRRKTTSDDSQPSDESQSTDTGLNDDIDADLSTLDPTSVQLGRSSVEGFGEVLVQSLVRIGRDRWTTQRTGGRGKLSYNRIQLCDPDGSGAVSDGQTQQNIKVEVEDDTDDEMINDGHPFDLAFGDLHVSSQHQHQHQYQTQHAGIPYALPRFIGEDEFISESDEFDSDDGESPVDHGWITDDSDDDEDDNGDGFIDEDEESIEYDDEFIDQDRFAWIGIDQFVKDPVQTSSTSDVRDLTQHRLEPVSSPGININMSVNDHPSIPTLSKSHSSAEPLHVTADPDTWRNGIPHVVMEHSNSECYLGITQPAPSSHYDAHEQFHGNDDDDGDDLESLLSFYSEQVPSPVTPDNGLVFDSGSAISRSSGTILPIDVCDDHDTTSHEPPASRLETHFGHVGQAHHGGIQNASWDNHGPYGTLHRIDPDCSMPIRQYPGYLGSGSIQALEDQMTADLFVDNRSDLELEGGYDQAHGKERYDTETHDVEPGFVSDSDDDLWSS